MHSTSPPPAAPVVIRLRVERFDQLAAEHGLNTDTDRAARIGIDRSTLSRIRRGENPPGERFIGGCLRAFPGTRFEDLFVVMPAQS